MKIKLLSFLATTYIRFVALTSRIIWIHRSIRDDHEASGKGFIYAFWHGRQVFLTYLHQGDPVHILISQSKDGEIIAQTCRAFGLLTIRGSSSRGGREALVKLQDILNANGHVGITPDGPRGPLREIQPGAIYLAQSTGCPIVPVAFGARRKWVFKSWDEFIVPKPFNRIAVIYGEPLKVNPNDDVDGKAAELKRRLDLVVHQVDEIAQGESAEK